MPSRSRPAWFSVAMGCSEEAEALTHRVDGVRHLRRHLRDRSGKKGRGCRHRATDGTYQQDCRDRCRYAEVRQPTNQWCQGQRQQTSQHQRQHEAARVVERSEKQDQEGAEDTDLHRRREDMPDRDNAARFVACRGYLHDAGLVPLSAAAEQIADDSKRGDRSERCLVGSLTVAEQRLTNGALVPAAYAQSRWPASPAPAREIRPRPS